MHPFRGRAAVRAQTLGMSHVFFCAVKGEGTCNP